MRKAQAKQIKQIKQSVKLLANERSNQPAFGIGYQPAIKELRAQRSDGPTERSALIRSRPQATFFGDFLFCQKRKLPSAGKALTPQSTEEASKSQEKQQTNGKHSQLKKHNKKAVLRKLLKALQLSIK
ncbi:hypothetical protein [Polaromonas sp.]|uniref:hypothetical protein n=1 Tax=Polaromonas sp. TaxID=1869339 RepID=UPI0013BC5B0C|nr:hypothetical protein [Polaromonas sp.]NDP61785.1 hypothetical protein [Polaromonas sp.]